MASLARSAPRSLGEVARPLADAAWLGVTLARVTGGSLSGLRGRIAGVSLASSASRDRVESELSSARELARESGSHPPTV